MRASIRSRKHIGLDSLIIDELRFRLVIPNPSVVCNSNYQKVSPDGKSAYLAYLDSTYKTVYVQQVDVTTFAAVGTAFSTAGYEAAGLVAQNDGFALLATVDATGTTDIPPNSYPIISVIRVKAGTEAWRTPLNGKAQFPRAIPRPKTSETGHR